MKLHLLSLAAILITGPAIGQDHKIVEITVNGNKNVNKESIIAASGLRIGDPLTEQSLEQAKKRILAMGCCQDWIADPSEAVKIEVVKNDRVERIKISGNGPISEQAIRGLISTRTGDALNIPILMRDVARIKESYERRGYQAYISEDLGIHEGVLEFPIVVGKVGTIKFKGLHKTKLIVVQREITSRSGDYYNVNRLRRDVTNLLNMDLFENVAPSFGFSKPGCVDIELSFSEKKTRQVVIATPPTRASKSKRRP